MVKMTLAMNTPELRDAAFLVTGIYGKPLPRQNGAPLRLARAHGRRKPACLPETPCKTGE